MTPLDDLDRALARMQGDDSGGSLPDALAAARRLRTAHGHLQRVEGRVRAKVHQTGAMTSAAVFAVGALLADGVAGYLCLAAVIVCTVAVDGPVSWRPVLRSLRTHPWVWAITIALGVAGGLGLGWALSRPSGLSIPVGVAAFALGLVWVGLLCRARTRGRKAVTS